MGIHENIIYLKFYVLLYILMTVYCNKRFSHCTKKIFLEIAIKLNIACKLSFLVVLDHIFKTNQDRTYHEATRKHLETELASEL